MKRSQIKRRPLADTVLDKLEPEDRDYREYDCAGLYFRVRKSGKKSWELRYKKPDGKWAWKNLGSYPKITGKFARTEAAKLQQQIAEGIDLNQADKPDKPLFRDTAEQWHQRKIAAGRTESTTRQMRVYLDSYILPALGDLPLDEITRSQCAQLQKIFEDRGTHNTAKKVRTWINQIFSLAVGQGLTDNNPASELRHIAAPAPQVQHYPHLLESELPAFLRALDNSPSRYITQILVRVVLLTACRPGMARNATWNEIDFTEQLWTIPAAKMKMRRDHIIPLSTQVTELLKGLYERTGTQIYLFPGNGAKHPVMSENTINKALSIIGYKTKLVGHGSRHTASTLLREHGWPKDYVESQLAHVEGGVAGIYNQAQYLTQRREMMQWYADYLDALKERGQTNDSQCIQKIP